MLIFNTQGNYKSVAHWTAKDNKQAIDTLSKSLSNKMTLVPINPSPADYWIHVGFENTSSPIDLLVWLPTNKPASFVYAYKEFDGSMGFGGTQQSYPISEENRDKLLQMIKNK